ncbi:MAG: flagellar protein FlgN [Clostridiales bacterium]|nr:flagellar protein FlgN [Clostridiales bacterium]
MASLIEELTTTLKKEEIIYSNIIPIQEEKTKVIVSNDLESLSLITKQEEEFINEINKLEKRREEIVKNIALVLGRDPASLNIRTIIELLKGQEEQKDLAAVYDDLARTLKRATSINERNKALIEQSLDMIEFNMNFYQSIQNINTNTYNKGAYNDDGLGQTGMFDAKQ